MLEVSTTLLAQATYSLFLLMSAQPQAKSAPNFDRVARLYRWAEYLALGPLLQRTRTAHLDRLAACRNALLFGDGDGRFLARLLVHHLHLNATAVDTSAGMLRLLQARCRRASPTAAVRLHTLRADAASAPIPAGTDLIVTHFFLDCLTQPEVDRLTAELASALRPGALWLVSDFSVPAKPALLRGAAGLYIRALYLAFRLLTGLRVQRLPDPQSALRSNGFRLIARRAELFGILYSELWVLERSLDAHGGGTTCALPGLIHTPMTPPADTTAAPKHFPADAQPDPEPAPPSLDEPDPGVFHRDPTTVIKPQAPSEAQHETA